MFGERTRFVVSFVDNLAQFSLNRFTDYFYTGQLSDEVQDVQVLADLLDLSDYWNVPHLQALTEMRMISHITPWTVDACRSSPLFLTSFSH